MKIFIGVDKIKDGFLKNNRETKRFFKNTFSKKDVSIKYISRKIAKKAQR